MRTSRFLQLVGALIDEDEEACETLHKAAEILALFNLVCDPELVAECRERLAVVVDNLHGKLERLEEAARRGEIDEEGSERTAELIAFPGAPA